MKSKQTSAISQQMFGSYEDYVEKQINIVFCFAIEIWLINKLYMICNKRVLTLKNDLRIKIIHLKSRLIWQCYRYH